MIRRFAMPTLCAVRKLVLLALALAALAAPPALASDMGDEPEAGFFSYLPAPPKLKLPSITIPFWTDDLKKAKNAYNDGNYSRAIKFFRKSSEDGNIVADWYLGHIYRTGKGVPVDPATAYSYYSRVAEAYDPEEGDSKRLRIMVDGQMRVADYLRTGIPSAGIPADPGAAARTYLRLASTYGHPDAQYQLGVLNLTGKGVRKNPQQGLKWLMAAARKRQPEAQAYLGSLYWDGKVVQRDETRALMWYILAQQTANPAENGAIIERADALRSEVSAETRLEAEARARVWADQYPGEDSLSP
jgi:hypothetical protein